jgi:hypothetical protein
VEQAGYSFNCVGFPPKRKKPQWRYVATPYCTYKERTSSKIFCQPKRIEEGKEEVVFALIL